MSNSLRLSRKMHFMSENEHGVCARALSRKRENRDTHFMRACAVEMDMRNSKSNFCASRPTQNAGATRANPGLNPALNSYRKNPLVRSTIWGTNQEIGEKQIRRGVEILNNIYIIYAEREWWRNPGKKQYILYILYIYIERVVEISLYKTKNIYIYIETFALLVLFAVCGFVCWFV